jgi:hypothetical protein
VDKPTHTKHGSIYVDHVHKLMELADRYHVGVASLLRSDMFKLQDSIIKAMQLANSKDPD